MNIIVLLIAVSLTLALVFLAIFFWCMKSGQYDDTYTPAVRMLFENKPREEKAQGSAEKGVAAHAPRIRRGTGKEEGHGSPSSTRPA